MRARLGINNCFALKRWPRPEDWARVVREDLGLQLVELSLDLVEGLDVPAERQRSIEVTRAALSSHGLVDRADHRGRRRPPYHRD
jgi:hypothetical protein